MSRPARSIWVFSAGLLIGLNVALARAQAGEDARTALAFVEELRERGLHELALEYLNVLRADPPLPANVKDVLDYEEGRTLIDEAAKSGDLVLREDLLKEAREKLEGFVKAHPQLPETREALVDLAKLLIERGHLAMLLSEETTDKAKKEAKVAEARAAFTEAHEAYAKAIEPLNAAYKKYAGFIPDDDPRKSRARPDLLRPLGCHAAKGRRRLRAGPDLPGRLARTRKSRSRKPRGQFETMYKSYRTQFAGLAAQMYQAKCYEEQGDVDAAIGIYKQLMEHGDPRLRELQRNVGYFYIVALAKRKQYALAADEASRWLATYNRRDERRSPEGLGVLIEMAKNIDAQMARTLDGRASQGHQPDRRGRQPGRALRIAVQERRDGPARRSTSRARPCGPKRSPGSPTKTLMGKADEAIGSHEWERAIALLTAAIRKADPAKNPDKANLARYNLAFCYYMNKEYYEAAVLAEHYARRYPQGGLGAKSTEIGMQVLGRRLLDLCRDRSSAAT